VRVCIATGWALNTRSQFWGYNMSNMDRKYVNIDAHNTEKEMSQNGRANWFRWHSYNERQNSHFNQNLFVYLFMKE